MITPKVLDQPVKRPGVASRAFRDVALLVVIVVPTSPFLFRNLPVQGAPEGVLGARCSVW